MTFAPETFVRRFLALTPADDPATWHEFLDPEVVWFGTRGGLDEDQVLHGPQAAIAYTREISEPWDDLRVHVEQVIEAGDLVLVFLREEARARHGGPEVRSDTAMIFKLRAERIVEITGYLDRAEALRAAGVA